MNKTKRSILIIFFILVFASMFFACNEYKLEDIEDIYVDFSDFKIEYEIGEDIQKDSIKAYLKLKDGEIYNIPSNELVIRNFDNTKLGEQIISVKYIIQGRDDIEFSKSIKVYVVKKHSEFQFKNTFLLDKVYDNKSVVDPQKDKDYILTTDQEVEIEYFMGQIKLPVKPINAGSYTVQLTAKENDTNDQKIISKDFVISPKELTVNWIGHQDSETNFEYKYTNSLIVPKAYVETGIDNEIVLLDVEGAQSGVGEYQATASLKIDNPNYVLTNTTKAFTITKAASQLSFLDSALFEKDYDNLAAITPEFIHYGDGEIAVEWYKDDVKLTEAPSNAGNYLIKIIKAETQEYCETSIEREYIINKIDYDISLLSFNSASVIYDGELHGISVTGQLPVGLDNIPLEVSYSRQIKNVADSGTIEAVFATQSINYNIPQNLSATLTIEPKGIQVTWTNTSLDYNGAAQKPTASAQTGIAEEVVEVYVSGEMTNAGEYVANASIEDTNYSLLDAQSNFVINKINYSDIIFNSQTKTYNGKTQNLEVESLPVGLDNIQVTVEYTEGLINVGQKEITATFASQSENYNTPTALTATLTIEAKQIDVIWGDLLFTYDNTSKLPSASVQTGVEGEELQLQVSGEQVDAGVYIATAQKATINANYELNNVSSEFTINKADYIMDGVEFNKGTLTYNGQIQNIQITGVLPTGLDGIQVSVTYSEGLKDVGQKEIVATFSTTSSNYNTPEEKRANLEISKKEVSINWANTEVTYDGLEHLPTASLDTGIVGEEYAVQIQDAPIINATTQALTITATVPTLTQNYTLVNNTTSFVINKANYEQITFASQSKPYNGEVQSLEVTALPTGIDGIQVSVTYSEGLKDVGQKEIVATFASQSENYNTPNALTATLTILPKQVDVIWGSTTLTYTSASQAPGASVQTGIVGETLTLQISGAKINAGDAYIATAQIYPENANYTLQNASVNFVILKANYDMSGITFENATKTYNGQMQTLEIEGTLPTGYDGIQVSVSYSEGLTNAGQKVITATFASKSENYNVPSSMSATLTIERAQSSIMLDSNYTALNKEADGVAITYADILPYLEITGDGAVVIEVNNVLVATSELSLVEAGDYTIKIYMAQGENYNAIAQQDAIELVITITEATV